MKTLIVEDDFTSRLLLQEILKRYGAVHIAVNGREAVDAVRESLSAGEPYNLICLDVMMPELNGHETLKDIRAQEEARAIKASDRAKVFMVTALGGMKDVFQAFHELCDVYLVKPIEVAKLLEHLQAFGLV